MPSHTRSQSIQSIQSICTVLSCTPEQFFDLYNDNGMSTKILTEDALLTARDREKLKTASGNKYRLDKLLDEMLIQAPSESGKRYVAVALHIAHTKGGNAIVEVAQAWMDHLFLPSKFPNSFSYHYSFQDQQC